MERLSEERIEELVREAEEGYNMIFCPTCRLGFLVTWRPPPYTVIHKVQEGVVSHLHPVTREPIKGTGFRYRRL